MAIELLTSFLAMVIIPRYHSICNRDENKEKRLIKGHRMAVEGFPEMGQYRKTFKKEKRF